MTRRARNRTGLYAAAVAIAVFSLFPIVWLVLSSLKSQREIEALTPDFWPDDPDFGRYWDVLTDGGIGRALLSSLIVSAAATLVGVLLAVLAGYAFARFKVPAKRYLLVLVMCVQMFPLVVLLIPLFIVMRNAGLLGSYWGLVLAYLAFTIPLAIWLLRGFIGTIPEELEEAAMLDGCSRFGAFVRVVLPLAAPGLAATATLSFISAWSEFMFALTFLGGGENRTLPVAINTFIGRGSVDWPSTMVASVIYIAPVVVFFLLIRKHLVRGLTAGALKG